MKHLLLSMLSCVVLLLQACAVTGSGNRNDVENCSAPGLGWMEGVHGYDKKEVSELATKYEVAAKENAEKIALQQEMVL